MRTIIPLYTRFLYYAGFLSPALLLTIRVWMAKVFWVSGVLKLQDFDTAIVLFTEEHPVPFLPPVVAAFLGTGFEVLCPILLVLGLATRLAALPLLVMTAVINFTYQEALEHYYWALLLGVLLTQGAGRWSLDAWIAQRVKLDGQKE